MDNQIGSRVEEAEKSFEFLLLQLRTYKPNDRSEQDRYWAITITELEKAIAIFKTYCRGQ